MLAGLADRIEVGAEADVLHAGKIGLGEIDAVDHFEIVGIQDDDLVAELVQNLPSGEISKALRP